METYRIINRELSLNNQELRNALNKLKHEVTYLNRQLLDQRQQFNRLKDSLATTIEKKCSEIMTLIYPEREAHTKFQSQMSLVSHRRSCSNVTAAESMKSRTFSPPAGSPATDLLVDANLRTPVPKIVVERDARISKSPRICPTVVDNQNQPSNSSDMQMSVECSDDRQSPENSQVGRSLCSPNNSTLGTINEELSGGVDSTNVTLTDATINNLLDAPCSTPYHSNKYSNETTLETKEMRVLVHKLSVDKISQLMMQNLREKSLQLSNLDGSTTLRPEKERESPTKTPPVAANSFRKKKAKENLNKTRKSSRAASKENNCSESENTCSEDESKVLSVNLRRRKKIVSLKEPSLRQKLRNTTNFKM